MLAKDANALTSLRAVKAAILLAKTAEGAKEELSSEDEIKIVHKLVKQRKDPLEIFEKQNRPDLAEKERNEILVIEKYLRAQLWPEELKAQLQKIIAEVGATSAADMGKVMGVANKALVGKAEGKAISTIVKELLA